MEHCSEWPPAAEAGTGETAGTGGRLALTSGSISNNRAFSTGDFCTAHSNLILPYSWSWPWCQNNLVGRMQCAVAVISTTEKGNLSSLHFILDFWSYIGS